MSYIVINVGFLVEMSATSKTGKWKDVKDFIIQDLEEYLKDNPVYTELILKAIADAKTELKSKDVTCIPIHKLFQWDYNVGYAIMKVRME